MLRYTTTEPMGIFHNIGRRYYIKLSDELVAVSRAEYYMSLLKVNTTKKGKK